MSAPAMVTMEPGEEHGATVAVALGDLKLRQPLAEALHTLPVDVLEDNCQLANLDELLAEIDRLRPDILLLGTSGYKWDPAVALGRITALQSAPRVVAVSDSAEAETILKFMRAGAAEFVYPPFGPEFEASLRRLIADSARTSGAIRAAGRVIGFVSVKGGCGATTLACHAAAHLRRAGKKEVLLADLDMSSGIAGTLMQAASRYTLEDALQHLNRMDLKLWKALVTQTSSGVDVMPAAVEPHANVQSASRKLPHMLRFWRAQYELSLLDLGHGMNPALIDVLDSLDSLVLVATDELPALRQTRQMIQLLAARNFGANRLRLVLNKAPKRTQIQLPELEKVLGHPIYCPIPDDRQGLNEAYSESRLMKPDSDLALKIGSFTQKLTGIAPATTKARRFFGLLQEA